METLAELRAKFPPQRGAFWFAAGVSFTSFALVDCIAVLGVEVAGGLAIPLMGLARAALPSTALTLAQLELALLVRFSTRDGVLWMQGQLTDNSYLLSKDVRLTGGFAYVSWFKGDKAGEFVLTLGGYHPSFHRDGYPIVPRLGFVWAIGKALVVKGESYFALTSEAIMVGTRFEARLTLGPLWAYIRLGADGIVYGDDDAPEPLPHGWDAFSAKYLRPGGAPVLSAVPGRGQVAPAPGGTDRPQTGTADDPFLVKPEFDLMVTTTVPYFAVQTGAHAPIGGLSDPLAVGPMHVASLNSVLHLRLYRRNVAEDQLWRVVHSWIMSQVPKGIWGPNGDDRPVPKGETLTGGTGILFTAFVIFTG